MAEAEEEAEEVAAEAEEVAAEAEEVAEEVAAEAESPCERKIDGQLLQPRSQLWMFQPRAPWLQRLIGLQTLQGGCGPWIQRG
jgi:hypothetical protein